MIYVVFDAFYGTIIGSAKTEPEAVLIGEKSGRLYFYNIERRDEK